MSGDLPALVAFRRMSFQRAAHKARSDGLPLRAEAKIALHGVHCRGSKQWFLKHKAWCKQVLCGSSGLEEFFSQDLHLMI